MEKMNEQGRTFQGAPGPVPATELVAWGWIMEATELLLGEVRAAVPVQAMFQGWVHGQLSKGQGDLCVVVAYHTCT